MRYPRTNRTTIRRWQIAGVAAAAVALVGVGLGVASAAETTVPTVNCPTVADQLPAVPAQAGAEIARNLALLNTQIAEANKRLATTVGQGGANFIQNAILGPLKDKRVATINRMATAIGRTAAKPVLDVQGLATCGLNENGGGVAAPEPTAVPSAGIAAAAAAPTVNCPAVAGQLGAVPAQAGAEIARNLALLNTQIAEANKRLATTVGQGGANFIQNAILGPLKDKRVATINRMATAIGRNAAKPVLDVQGLATCGLNENGGGVAAPEPTAVPSAGIAAAAAAPTVNCPAVAGQLGAVPAQAGAEIARNLALLNTQIAEANKRLATTVGQGGANFIQNAILGPLKDKRVATINRMATAIGRTAAKPVLDVQGLATCTLNQNGGGVAAPEPTAVPSGGAATTAAAPTVNCPSVALPAIPAQAQAEVERNVALLDTQIAEANTRLATTVGQGGANFIQNAILGPLKDKRVATINRIATAIGRTAAKPDLNVAAVAACTLNS